MPESMLVPMHRVEGPYIEALTTAIKILETAELGYPSDFDHGHLV